MNLQDALFPPTMIPAAGACNPARPPTPTGGATIGPGPIPV